MSLYGDLMHAYQRAVILDAIAHCGSKKAAAGYLGIHRNTLNRLLEVSELRVVPDAHMVRMK